MIHNNTYRFCISFIKIKCFRNNIKLKYFTQPEKKTIQLLESRVCFEKIKVTENYIIE